MSDNLSLASLPTAHWPKDIDLNMEEVNKLLCTDEFENTFEMSEFQEILKDLQLPDDLLELEEISETEKSEESISSAEGQLSQSTSASEPIAESDTSLPAPEFSGTGHIPTLSIEYSCQFNYQAKHTVQLAFACGPKCRQSQLQPMIQKNQRKNAKSQEGGARVIPTSCRGRGDKNIKAVTRRRKPIGPKRQHKKILVEKSSRTLRTRNSIEKKKSKSVKKDSKPQQGKTKGKKRADNKKSVRPVGKLQGLSKKVQTKIHSNWTVREKMLHTKFGLRKCSISLPRLKFMWSNSSCRLLIK